MRRRLWNRTRTGLRAGFGQLESWASGMRGVATPTSKQRATRRPALGAEPLEARLLLDATVSITAVDPDLRNTALNEIAIEFTEPVSGFDTTDLIFAHDGASLPLSGNQLTTADNQSFRLTSLAPLTGGEGNYQLTLDVLNSGISPLSLEGLGVTPGPELVENGTFDSIDQLDGWLISNVNGVRWEDGVARITSLHPTINDPDLPIGSSGANIQQEFAVLPHTKYRIEFDLISTNIGGGTRVNFNIFEGDASGPLLLGERLFAQPDAHREFKLVTAADDAVTIQFTASLVNRDFTVDNVSVRRAAVLGPSVGWTMDTTAPTVTISAVASPRNTAVDAFTIAFDEPIENFDLSDLSLTRDSGGGPQEVPIGVAQLSTSDNTTWTLSNLTTRTNQAGVFDYELKIRAAGTGIQDPATNPLGPTSGSSWHMDTVAPIVTIAQQLDVDDRSPALSGTVNDPTAEMTVTVAGELYEAVNHLNGTWSLAANTIEDLDDRTYNVVVTATDPAGNPGSDSTTNDLRIDAAPRVTVDQIRTADQTPQVTGTIDDPLATISRLIINGVNYDAPAVINHGDGTWELPDNTILVEDTLPEGKYDVSFVAFDTTGHFAGSLANPVVVSDVLDIDLKPIVINEIMFHPLSALPEPAPAGNSEPTDEEWVELYNNSVFPIDVGGWEFTSGFSYTIPQGTVIPSRGYLAVAANKAVFQAIYPNVDVNRVVGGDGSGSPLTDWIGTLSNSGENIRFERNDGDLVDRVKYGDSGDWAVRRLLNHPVGGALGWEWVAPHDDDGHSVELMNPDLTNREGQNWAPSAAPLGTPGAANSAASNDIAPMLIDVQHSPAIPRSADIAPADGVADDVVISARIVNEAESGVDVTLFYRVAPTNNNAAFTSLPMRDDGNIDGGGGVSGSGDATAGDGVFSAIVPAQANRAIVDFYVEASENGGANVRSYPSPSDDAGNHNANLQFQFDDTVAEDFLDPWPVDQPIYRLVQTREEANGLEAHTGRQDHLENGTFIVHDPSRGIDVDNGDLVLLGLNEISDTGTFRLDTEVLSILFRENLFVGGENIDAVHVRENGNIILSTSTGATLPAVDDGMNNGLLTFTDGDLVEYSPETGTARLIVLETAFGVQDKNLDIDAIWVKETGGPDSRITELIISTDDDLEVGNDDFENGDLVKIVLPGGLNLNLTPLESLDDSSVTRVVSEDSLFVGGADIDGVHFDNGHYLISTAGREQIVDLVFSDGTVVRVNPVTEEATLFFDESNFASGDEDINALFVDPLSEVMVLSTDGDNAELGSDTEIFYNIGARNRGNGSRGSAEQNLRVAFASDHLFHGESSIPLNTQNSHSQLLGMTIFHEAGLSAEAPVMAVQVRRQGLNDAGSTLNYGAYVQLQARDGNLPNANYPLDSGGNLYALDDRPGDNNFDATFRLSPDGDFKDRVGHDTGYAKQTNSSADDWRDLPELSRALSTSLTPNTAGGDDLNFVHKVSQVINVSQWLRHMAVTGLIRNNEGGYADSGRGDDYGLYHGELDTRFEFVPHDLDTTFAGATTDIIRGSIGSPFTGLFRVLDHPAFRAIFAGHLLDLVENVFNSEHLDPIIDELFGEGDGDWIPTNVITQYKTYISDRVVEVHRRIDADLENLGEPVSPHDLSQLANYPELEDYIGLADQQRYLRISEIMFNPEGEELEFVELINMGDAPLDLTGVHFKGGILFGFNHGAPIESPIPQTPETILAAGERVLVVKNEAAFLAHYDPDNLDPELRNRIAGEFWNGSLSNNGERILLEGRLGEPILDFSYNDNWYNQADGEGFSLVLREGIDENTPRTAWGEKGTWRASGFINGTPGEDSRLLEHEPDAIRINEVLSHTDRGLGDWIELHNTTNAPIDISGWYLSDASNNLHKFRIPDNTEIPGGGFWTVDQYGPGGFAENWVRNPNRIGPDNPLGDPGAFGLSELGDTLRLSSVDPDDVRENIDAAHVMPSGNILLSTAGTAMLGDNALSFRNGDLVEYNPTTGDATLRFSELSFVGVAENIDAVSMLGGDFVFSTGGPALLPAAAGTPGNVIQMLVGGVMTDVLSFGNGDLVSWDPNSNRATLVFSEMLFDPESSGGLRDENIDAVHVLGNNEFIISTGGPASINGQLFDDGDLIRVETSAGGTVLQSVSRYFSESLFAIEEGNVVPTENIDAVFVDEARGPNGTVMLSAASTFSLSSTLSTPVVLFDDGDLVEIRLGSGADLASVLPSFGNGASASRLLAEDPADGSITFYGEPAGYRETADFGAAQSEFTFGIYEKSPSSTDSTDFTAQVFNSRGGINGAPLIGPVVINEIMYNPFVEPNMQQGEDGVEFVELFNLTNSPIVLTGWTISSAFNFEFSVGKTIPANGYLLLVSDATAFENPHGVPAAQILEYSGRLDNNGETVRLNKPGDVEPDGFVPAILVDRVRYDDEAPWPAEGDEGADGSGRSLSRFVSTDYGNDVVNWLPSQVLGGSPGIVNTTFDVSPPEAPTNVTSQTFSGVWILSWSPAFEPHSGVEFYTIYRDDQFLSQSQNTTFGDTNVTNSATHEYEITATNLSGKESERSSPLSVAVLRHSSNQMPTVTEVRVRFSENLDAASVVDIGNYAITGPTAVTVVSARRDDANRRIVILTTSPMEEQAAYELRVANLLAAGGNTLLLPDAPPITVNVPDLTAPRITELLIASTDWSQEFFTHLETASLGTGGFSIPGGAQQLSTIGWSNVNQIIMRFSEPVVVQIDDLSVVGVNRPSATISNFAYDEVSRTATWTLQGSLSADKLLLELSGDVRDIENSPFGGGNPVDGNWVDGQSSFPSGNGVIESDDAFAFSINVLPGDNDEGDVARSDLVSAIGHLGTQAGQPNYDPHFDTDGSGRVDVDDLRQILRRLLTSLPTGTPSGGGPVPVVAVDAVFRRVGAAGSPAAALADASIVSISRRVDHAAGIRPISAIDGADASQMGRRSAARRSAIQAVDLALADADDDGLLPSPRTSIRQGRRSSRR